MLKHFVFSTLIFSSQAYLPDDYQTRTAADKKSYLFGQCQATAGTQGDYAGAGDLAALMWRDINPTFDHDSDEMPYTRGKPIHEVGWVATAKFTALKNPFTGVFQGSDDVILRFSLAQKETKNNITPGVGVKFLRSNMRSGNFVAMYSLEGQSSLNFFANDFRNHVDEPTGFALKLLAKKFETASVPATHVGLSDLASYTVDGEEIDDVNFPYQLILRPTNEIRSLNYMIDDLGKIKVGSKVWDVLAQARPDATELMPIGSFTTTSELVKTKYGDDVLFFQHQRIEEDLALRPNWKKYVGDSNKRALPCPLGFN